MMFDLGRSIAEYQPEFQAAIARVLASGRLILGEEVAAFEREFAAQFGSPHAVGVGSGFAALALALLALGIGPGDEVITVANTAVPTAAAIRSVGAAVRFVDVDPRSLVMTAEQVEPAIGSRTAAVLPVHLYGQPVDMTALVNLACRRGLKIVEDCSHAHGATWQGRGVGTFGDVGCFSCYPTKNLGAFGDAGVCVTSDAMLAQRLRQLRVYGCDPSGVAINQGRNSRLDELQAAVLRVRLAHFGQTFAARRALAAGYLERLRHSSLTLPHPVGNVTHAYHLFVIRTSERARLVKRLRASRIDTTIHYPLPLHHMPAFRDEGSPPALPVTERMVQEIVSLPLYTGMPLTDLERVTSAIEAALST
ncbi:MAG: DegT/DnrJ/EryC1/StrS family aminotransferase [Planctomycetes bacterium]|nr:DegT/DnrJ/EryC1/StrS family aminotransferase [Planctomycetota bacterium]